MKLILLNDHVILDTECSDFFPFPLEFLLICRRNRQQSRQPTEIISACKSLLEITTCVAGFCHSFVSNIRISCSIKSSVIDTEEVLQIAGHRLRIFLLDEDIKVNAGEEIDE